MNFLEAKNKLACIADGRYHYLEYRITDTGNSNNNIIEQECCVYIHGICKIFHGKTWNDALNKLEDNINPPIVEIEDVKEILNGNNDND